ncbi:acyl-CoA dehydrogenase [Tistrella bauzanensis]|uniref:Acyl-CoA dehydrogenase n=1 Tax=Tistrella bauzanensis TaxID=657419 RepID=A0ABQ1IPV3_9PROT|nr:acyl-CoA dehydrogenase family protein [Tistrella bauzanensis]GGB48523.1 acyl-CoA dehydrogenase [Tistrella bauzanensis]
MQFDHSPEVEALCQRLRDFMDHYILPANAAFHHAVAAGGHPVELIERLKARAWEAGLWNMFLPSLADDQPGLRLSNLDYAPLAEIMGRVSWSAEVFNCAAPDSGNMELLQLFGSAAQKARWLDPLLTGEIRSVFCMSEPDAASSDPTNLATTIRRDGDDYVIDGRKWFITGTRHPKLKVAIVFGITDPDPAAARHRRHSFVIVPIDQPGVSITRDITLMGAHSPEGHGEVVFRGVRVPACNLIGEEGSAFAIAQARLGPGRVHHAMRSIGQCELALELMTERALERRVFGQTLAERANIRDWIAESRIEIDQCRLLVLHAAWLMDTKGNAAARTAVSAIKLASARLQTRVVDRAMQVFGAAGLSPDTPLAALWNWGRALRVLDGPDEVHLQTVARAELAAARAATGRNALHFVAPAV